MEGNKDDDTATSKPEEEKESGKEKEPEGPTSSEASSSVDVNKNESSLDTDPYHYTKRGEFTSEVYKIEIQNLPRHYGFVELKKMLHKLGLNPKKVKGIPKSNYAFVTFSNEEERQNALSVIKGHSWKKRKLTAKIAKPVADPVTCKRKQETEEEEEEEDAKKPKLSVEESVSSAVTPLVNHSYEEQLDMKQKEMEDFISFLTREFDKSIPEMRKWLKQQKAKNDGKCCRVERIKASPVIDGYRNKCEFTIGMSQDGKEKTVGFRVGKYKGGHTAVANPLSCKHLSPASKRVVEGIQKYMDQSSLQFFDPVSHEGHWSLLTVRTTEGSDVMATLQIHPQELTPAQIEEEKDKLRKYFSEGEGVSAGITSLFLQLVGKGLKEKGFETNFHHVSGNSHITEDLLGLKFRISQDAFFQVNTKAAEVLFKTAGEWAQVSSESILLDVCCGTGTIGLSLAQKVKMVIGVEMSQPAVDDAKVNAESNGITNTKYICGKAEDVLNTVTHDIKESEKVIGIVDPPRAGIHQRVIHAIRRCEGMRRLVFLSCNPYAAWGNFVDLCRPVSIRYKGTPFRLTKVVPVDLFPHTKHCELVLLFQREGEEDVMDDDTDDDGRKKDGSTKTGAPHGSGNHRTL